MHVTTSRSWLVKGQEVHIHVHWVRGFSCPSDCLVDLTRDQKHTFVRMNQIQLQERQENMNGFKK
jgi:hypothetical protein